MLKALRDPLGRIARLWAEEVLAVLTWRPGLRYLAARVALIWAIETVGLLILPRYLGGLSVDGPAGALGGVIVYQVLNASIRPILVYLVLPLAILSFGLLVLAINGLMFWLAAAAAPGVDVDGPLTAFVAALGLALVNMLVTGVLDLDEEASFYRNVSQRLARRGRASKRIERPGLVVIQVDGLGHDVLLRALQSGQMPHVARWLRGGSHHLVRWECGLPSQTSASQAGILYGDNHDIPAFRWYEKETGRLLVSNRPADANEIERRHSNARGLLAINGSSVGNLFSGDATRSVLTTSTIADLRPGIARRSRDFFLYFVNPYTATRALARMIAEIGIEAYEGRRQRRRGVEPRIHRGGAFPFLRAVSCVLLRDLTVTMLIEDMVRGVAVAYADFLAYDEVAHHAGPERPEAMRTLEEVDRKVRELEQAATSGSRPYRFVLLSDHGQSQGATFRQRYGVTLEELVRSGMAGRPSVAAATGAVESWGPLNAFLSEVVAGAGFVARAARRLLGRGAQAGFVEVGPSRTERVPSEAADRPDLVVCASGNLGLIYFPGRADRLSLEEIESGHPGLVAALAGHPGVGFVLVRTAERGAVALGARGRRWLADDQVDGEDPLAVFGPLAAGHLRRLDGFPHVGDLVVNSLVDPASGEVAAFEELVGSHGGIGGPQTAPFLLYPADLPAPSGPLVGAPAVHLTIRGWLEALAAEGG
jgi:uncharacterized membrane protein YvlD (DUF360 family)